MLFQAYVFDLHLVLQGHVYAVNTGFQLHQPGWLGIVKVRCI